MECNGSVDVRSAARARWPSAAAAPASGPRPAWAEGNAEQRVPLRLLEIAVAGVLGQVVVAVRLADRQQALAVGGGLVGLAQAREVGADRARFCRHGEEAVRLAPLAEVHPVRAVGTPNSIGMRFAGVAVGGVERRLPPASQYAILLIR